MLEAGAFQAQRCWNPVDLGEEGGRPVEDLVVEEVLEVVMEDDLDVVMEDLVVEEVHGVDIGDPQRLVEGAAAPY